MVAASDLKDNLMDIANNTYIDDCVQKALDESEEELAKKAQEKIDEKNTVTKNDETTEKEEEKEKDKSISEEDSKDDDSIESLYEMPVHRFLNNYLI